ncbi:MAG: ribosomal-processing cysteine protease Prp [Clostridia bacterium]
MIFIKIKKNASKVSIVEINGHSGYAKYDRDIVCSAVSAIAQTALMGIIDVSESEVMYKIGEEGYLKFEIPTPQSEIEDIKQQTIISTMILGLRDIEKGYNAFVKLEGN